MKLSPLAFALTSLGIVTLFQPAQAASSCKGLESPACAKQAHCSWTQAYTRKDGKQVNGYCRTARKPIIQSSRQVSDTLAKTQKTSGASANKKR